MIERDTSASSESTPDAAGTSPIPFETILEQLEELVKKLEQGSLPLETSLTMFEKGMALSRMGSQILETAERKVEQLLQQKGGDTVVAIFPNESDE
ncbi:MAG: exodeoxyribonuclease VII small subunit [Myxococcales bacterium]|nr:exodeoxyribonuclease VII small subunit [Myxococcales bacterium]